MSLVIRILIVDDHPFFSAGIQNALLPYPEYEIVATLEDGNQVMDSLSQHKPDIIILDINLPGINGLELLPLIKKKYPATRIMILSMYMPEDVQLDLTNTSLDAYVIKNSGTETLLMALNELKEGNRFFDPIINKDNHHSSDKFSQRLKLSSREKDIIVLLKEGLTSKEIAEKLFISELTVQTHRKNIMNKLEVRNVAELLKKV